MFKQPLLAAKTTDADLRALKYPVLVSPKIDGIRATVVNGKLMSRKLIEIPNPHVQQAYGRPELEGLDGELVVGSPTGKNCMQRSMGVTRKSGIVNADFYTFDKWDSDQPFRFRTSLAHGVVSLNRHIVPGLIHLQQSYVHSYEDLLVQEKMYLQEGYEGLMVRDPHGRYKQGRSTVREGILLKVKRFDDSEAQILRCNPLERNTNTQERDALGYAKRSSSVAGKVADDLLGSLDVQDVRTGVIFNIGSGFSERERISLWRDRDSLVGKFVRYKYFSVGVKDKPRFPIFTGFRSPLDMVR